jgi:hypothetical protein
VDLAKSEFSATNIKYLGFRLTPEGILSGLDRHCTVQEIRQFMGLCNFFRSHIPNIATINAPLNKLTYKEANWKGRDLPENCLESVNSQNTALILKPIVDYPRKHRPYSLILDTSTGTSEMNGGLGHALPNRSRGRRKSNSYASRQLLKHEKNYTVKC